MRPHKISEAILNVIAAGDEVLAARAVADQANLADSRTSLPRIGRTRALADAKPASALVE